MLQLWELTYTYLGRIASALERTFALLFLPFSETLNEIASAFGLTIDVTELPLWLQNIRLFELVLGELMIAVILTAMIKTVIAIVTPI